MILPLLAIDTAGPRLQLATLTETGVETLSEEMQQGQAERIVPAIEDLLQRSGLSYEDIRRIAVTSGPGSFTGLRIGLSAARGLGLALGVPVLGIPSLLALSLGHQGPTSVLLDARRGEAYFQRFSGPGTPACEPALLPMEMARESVLEGEAVIVSDKADIEALARFAAAADPALYPPEASYVRSADAKPQDKYRVARLGS
jgi:tRNA threonylcarbamoyladenosine biosynthesis protein TsaB